MARIKQPEPGQVFWTVVNGQICQRIYVRRSEADAGHILKFPDYEGSYFESYLFAYEHKSDLLAQHLEAARKQAEEAVARVPHAELAYRNALRDEREATYAASLVQTA